MNLEELFKEINKLKAEADSEKDTKKKASLLKQHATLKNKAFKLAKEADQFYTNPLVAKACFDILCKHINIKEYDVGIECAAGEGFILDTFSNIKGLEAVGLDLYPKKSHILKQDFLTFDYSGLLGSKVFTFSNPPFGKRSKLAKEFFNICAKFSDCVAFIIPIAWEKYEIHSSLDSDFSLVFSRPLSEISKEPAFLIAEDPVDHIKCVFQIWKKKKEGLVDLRIHTPPPKTHPDFELYQYNNTVQARKVFEEDWDFGVYRQGYANYQERVLPDDEISFSKQYILFKAKDKKTLARLMSLDFDSLSKTQTTTPGFSKTDVVSLYIKKFGA